MEAPVKLRPFEKCWPIVAVRKGTCKSQDYSALVSKAETSSSRPLKANNRSCDVFFIAVRKSKSSVRHNIKKLSGGKVNNKELFPNQ